MRTDATKSLSIEDYDDIAQLGTDGQVHAATQLKHHCKSSPMTDSSPDLWKTLRVWLETPALRIDNGPLLYLVTTSEAPKDSALACLKIENESRARVQTSYGSCQKVHSRRNKGRTGGLA